MDIDIRSPEFWLDQWRSSIEGDTKKIGARFANPAFWDAMAGRYDEDFGDAGQRALDALVDSFEHKGIFAPDMEVLDIGCGTGRLAIALAGRGAHVTALDSSAGMLARLDGNLPADLAGHIDTVHAPWDTIDLDARGWRGRFDLVTASMTPAINGPETFSAMLLAGRHGWYYKAWAAREQGHVHAMVWQRLLGGPPRDTYAPIFYIVNFLAASGLWPHLYFEDVAHERTSTATQAVQSAMTYFSGMPAVAGGDIEAAVTDVVCDMAHDGILTETMRGTTGTLMWKGNGAV